MKRDSRLSLSLHALLHLGEAAVPITSEDLGARLEVNAVVLRRTMAGLREAQIVGSEKGPGGGWRLLRPLDAVTLADVHAALGIGAVFAIGHRTESPGCLVEQAVHRAMAAAFDAAEALLVEGLAKVTLADVAADVRRRGTLGPRRADGTKRKGEGACATRT